MSIIKNATAAAIFSGALLLSSIGFSEQAYASNEEVNKEVIEATVTPSEEITNEDSPFMALTKKIVHFLKVKKEEKDKELAEEKDKELAKEIPAEIPNDETSMEEYIEEKKTLISLTKLIFGGTNEEAVNFVMFLDGIGEILDSKEND